jgi:hypothetical protein
MINIHPDARNNFNEKANLLISSVKTIHLPNSHNKNLFDPDIHVKHHFTDKDIIGEIRMGAVDFWGNQVAFYFEDGNKQVGIEGENYTSVRKLSESIFKLKDVKQKISLKTIENLLCEWIKLRYFNKELLDFTEYFNSKAKDLVSEVSVWTPISNLCIQEPFRLGKVIFRPITKEIIDRWKQQLIENVPDKKEIINNITEKEMRPFQGYTAATIDLTAEKERAQEILIEEANKSLSFLRIFTGSILHPRAISFFGLWGSTHINGIKIIFMKNKEEYDGMNDQIIGLPIKVDKLDKNIINMLFQIGLSTIDKLLNSKSLSSFSSDILDALILYSRAGISKDAADKLVYMLVALESILLKNSSEPIQQNVGERLAFLIGNNLEERKKLKKIYKTFTE